MMDLDNGPNPCLPELQLPRWLSPFCFQNAYQVGAFYVNMIGVIIWVISIAFQLGKTVKALMNPDEPSRAPFSILGMVLWILCAIFCVLGSWMSPFQGISVYLYLIYLFFSLLLAYLNCNQLRKEARSSEISWISQNDIWWTVVGIVVTLLVFAGAGSVYFLSTDEIHKDMLGYAVVMLGLFFHSMFSVHWFRDLKKRRTPVTVSMTFLHLMTLTFALRLLAFGVLIMNSSVGMLEPLFETIWVMLIVGNLVTNVMCTYYVWLINNTPDAAYNNYEHLMGENE